MPRDTDVAVARDESVSEIARDEVEVSAETKSAEPPVSLSQIRDDGDVFDSTSDAECHNIWGKIILRLRDDNNFILHAICSSMSRVRIEGDAFIISSDNESELDAVESNVTRFDEIIKSLGYDYKVVVERFESPRVINNQNIKILRDIFGDNLEIEHD